MEQVKALKGSRSKDIVSNKFSLIANRVNFLLLTILMSTHNRKKSWNLWNSINNFLEEKIV